jgi:hypothetical protein
MDLAGFAKRDIHILMNLWGYMILRSGWWFGTFFTFPYIENFIIPTD